MMKNCFAKEIDLEHLHSQDIEITRTVIHFHLTENYSQKEQVSFSADTAVLL